MTSATDQANEILAILLSATEPEAPKPAPFVKRYFYRCADCLSVVATLAKVAEKMTRSGYRVPDAECGACGGGIEFMGATERHHAIMEKTIGHRAACDGKCISAVGPSCDCQCGGANHGSGMVVSVIEQGGVPMLKVPENAKAKTETFRALCDSFMAAWTARYGYVTEQKHLRYLDGAEFGRYMDGSNLMRAYHKARAMRSHAGRNKRLIALTAEAQK